MLLPINPLTSQCAYDDFFICEELIQLLNVIALVCSTKLQSWNTATLKTPIDPNAHEVQ